VGTADPTVCNRPKFWGRLCPPYPALHHKYADVLHTDEVIAHLAGLVRGRNAT